MKLKKTSDSSITMQNENTHDLQLQLPIKTSEFKNSTPSFPQVKCRKSPVTTSSNGNSSSSNIINKQNHSKFLLPISIPLTHHTADMAQFH
jgi:hypothetical protein